MKLSGTGHRPIRLGISYSDEDRYKLFKFAIQEIYKLKDVESITSGLAQGWDQAIAEAAIELGIPLIGAVPFLGQESQWPLSAKERYAQILDKCHEVHVICKGDYNPKHFIARDKWMVDTTTHVIVLYDGKKIPKSGTRTTLEYAQSKGREIINCWENWCNFR